MRDALYAVDAESAQKRVLLPPGEGGTISYSPDGATMAIMSLDGLALAEVGEEPRPVEDPLWLDAGRFLLVQSGEENLEIRLGTLDGGTKLLLTPQESGDFAYASRSPE